MADRMADRMAELLTKRLILIKADAIASAFFVVRRAAGLGPAGEEAALRRGRGAAGPSGAADGGSRLQSREGEG